MFWQFTLLFLFTNTKCIKYKSCSKFCPLSIQKLYKQFDLLCYTISVTVLIVFVLQIRFKINIFELYNFIQSNFVIKAIQFMLNLYIFDQYYVSFTIYIFVVFSNHYFFSCYFFTYKYLYCISAQAIYYFGIQTGRFTVEKFYFVRRTEDFEKIII